MSERAPAAVPSCHSGAAGQLAAEGAPVVALAGAPNVGKSTLFNALTGARREVGNWPGTSVEVGRAEWQVRSRDETTSVALVDLPGAYSLDPLSPDEELTRELVWDVTPAERPDVVVVVVDAARLARSLYLVAHLRERGGRVVLALTMSDVAARRGVHVDVPALSRHAGCPVVRIDPRHQVGDEDLAEAVGEVLRTASPAPRPVPAGLADDVDRADERFGWIDAAVRACVTDKSSQARTVSDRLDRWLLSAWLGPLVFLAVMWLVFQLTTVVAAPLQDALDRLISGPLAGGVQTALDLVGLGDSWLSSFLINGLLAGVGMLLTFVPLMAIMFALLALLEDSGYMARAAVVTDRTMRLIGLPGRAFLPLVVGFGCNVPAVSATRVLPDARHRVLTALLVPFTSCSARLAVYVMVAATFFPDNAGNVVFAMYVVSILFVILVGLALRSTLWRSVGREPLLMDLPPYQLPHLRILGSVTWLRLKGFLKTASGIIIVTVSLVWLVQAIPTTSAYSFADVPVSDSLYASAARTVTPVFEPTGFGNWQAVGALAVGFVAKEAVISSWAQTYALEAPDDLKSPGALGTAVQDDFAASSGGHTTAAVWAFLVFLLAYTPCVATLATQWREIGRKWTLFGVGMQLTVAWVAAVLVFQVGRMLT